MLFKKKPHIEKVTYYATRKEAEAERRRGDRLLFEDGKGYFIRRINRPFWIGETTLTNISCYSKHTNLKANSAEKSFRRDSFSNRVTFDF